MLTVKDLKEQLANLPDDALVYVEADHGQLPEQACSLFITDSSQTDHYGDDIAWEDSVSDIAKVTAILIGY
jgi:hypothetical protein